ncbi:DUF3126 family protein [Roseomonas sp. CCTCC AB2023176]|uniref:DUF3126 family protein n=1 Tax=Roseomonas sp. CCTCC AB2023176 TaxID=3342640 RepID=UPI0035E02CAC
MNVTKSEIERVQAYLRRLLGTERIRIIAPPRAGMSIEVAAGDEVIGTLHRDAEDGEVSYAVHLTVLEEDLPPAAQPAPATAAGARRGR